MATDPAILSAIPHRPPMLLIDAIDEQSENRIVCRKQFRADEYFFQGHYPDYPLVPGVILCEATMQAGAILLSRFTQETTGVPVATRMSDVKFKKMIRPGDTVVIDVDLKERVNDVFFLTGRVRCEGELAARLDFACAVTAAR